ncbi:MAG: hypothetical protein Q4C20_13845 [Erysipelotrichaceae bacterium]|nr:hypothetical protein [Erysipelotrichaceae bacterium]
MEKVDLLKGMANYKKLEGEEKAKFKEALLLAELQFEPLHMELKRRIEEKYAKFKKMQEDKVEYDDLDDYCLYLGMIKRIANGGGFSMLFSDNRNIEAGLTNRMRRIMYNHLGYPLEGIREIIHALREEEYNLRSLEMHEPSKLIEAYDKLFEDKEKDHEDSEAD